LPAFPVVRYNSRTICGVFCERELRRTLSESNYDRNDLRVTKETTPGLYSDGAGLYLRIGDTGTKSWIFRYMLAGKARKMGLGATHTRPGPPEGSGCATASRRSRDDPLAQKDAAKAKRRLEAALKITFEACAEKYIAAHARSWRNEKHRGQWRSTFGDVRLFLKSGHLFQKLETAKRHSVTAITFYVVSVR
jgi:hypothetical protein